MPYNFTLSVVELRGVLYDGLNNGHEGDFLQVKPQRFAHKAWNTLLSKAVLFFQLFST